MHVSGRYIDLLKPAIFGLACSFVFRMASRISLGPPGCRSSFSRKDGGADLEHARCALGINFGVYPHYGDVCDIYLFAQVSRRGRASSVREASRPRVEFLP